MTTFRALGLLAVGAMALTLSNATAQSISLDEARAIAKDAYVWGFPLVDNYRIQYSYFVDKAGSEYKTPWNTIFNNARVYTPDDKAIQTPNSDTPYSYVGADLRAEPIVLTVPEVDKGRYYSLQFIDMYTFNFAYVGSRATGNEAGSFLLAGPNWKGEAPAGIKAVIRSETEFDFVLYRTQLFGPNDIDNVKKIQAGYKVEPLSTFLGQPAPSAPPAIDFMKPLSAADEKTSLEFFNELNFVLQFCPTHPSETELRARFARLGIEPSKTFDPRALSPELRKAVEAGMADAWAAADEYKRTEVDTGKRTSGDSFGTRAFLKNDYLTRMSAAQLGIYGNSKDEAIYPAYFVDADHKPMDGSNRYALRFAPDQLPPVNAFWSLTLYELPASLLSANPLDRYLINSPMLPNLKKDADGGVTLYVQHEPPGAGKEANWLPAPSGLFFLAMRLYWPKPEALDGTWKAPPLERAK
ncbi:cell envelope protein [Rhizobium altiplani]|uniref:Cell envelope protein n=1 Tax=Rhizobium altiplani TaxID=1864509 RepID=A0A109JZF3_9HYPH|nr:cell envelope protein [Rhizobium altiplani]